jgi:hypothetical protein
MRPGQYPDGVAQSEAGVLAIARSAARSSSWAPVRALWVAPPASDTLRWKSLSSSANVPASERAVAIFNSPVCSR